MTDNSQQSAKDPAFGHEDLMAQADSPTNISRNRLVSRYVEIERRSSTNSVFQVDEFAFPSIMPRPSHWSVVWSDLMMTMFILFLVMFAYQKANEEFLQKKKPEIIGGDTTEALQTLDSSGASFPFAPIHPGLPLMTAGKIKKVEPVHEAPQMSGTAEQPASPESLKAQIPAGIKPVEKVAIMVEKDKNIPPLFAAMPIPGPDEDVVRPLPLVPEQKTAPHADNFQEMYTLSKDALENNNLEKFAAIDIVPDQTMRIILTGDLIFDIGQSDLSEDARNSLEKVASIIKNTPYMINVVGHTDNTPMRSGRFSSNWELSVSRASTVARYLIDEIGMDPNQFVVSGYSSYRPVVANTTAENRAKNRRVEIIISKRLPSPVPATPENLN